MTRRRLQSCLLIALLAGAAACGRRQEATGGDAGTVPAAAPAPAPGAWFEEVADSGVDFVHFASIAGRFYFPELVGSGGALFDYDRDGDLDLFAVQGARLGDVADGELQFPPPPRLGDRLWRNDTAGPDAPLRFTDVTAESGLGGVRGYGMGAAVGDVDGDGWPDLYVTRYGANTLWRNRGDGGFDDWTERSGTGDERWSLSAAFLDLDGDGDDDLYVTNYVDYRIEDDRQCRSPSGRPDYCGPDSYPPEPDRLLRNRGDGTFEDLSGPAGLLAVPSTGFGVIDLDADGDGDRDVYVANDRRPNHLWRNLGGGRFAEEALAFGLAVNADGVAEASMGLAAVDVDRDGREDVLATHFDQESHTLWLASAGTLFVDRTRERGLAAPTLDVTGFGVAMTDLDGDGLVDLLAVNGAVRLLEGLAAAGDPFPFHQRDQLFRQQADGRFALLSAAEAGAVAAPSTVSRGLATGDLDQDGDRDAVVFDNSGALRILRNRVGQDRPWIGLRPVARIAGGGLREVLGTEVGVERRGAPTLWRTARTAGSYLVANDPRVQIGLGDDATITGIVVRWPDGAEERWQPLAPGRYHDLVRGEGAS